MSLATKRASKPAAKQFQMKISRDTVLIMCQYLTVSELINLVDPLCKRIRIGIRNSPIVYAGRSTIKMKIET